MECLRTSARTASSLHPISETNKHLFLLRTVGARFHEKNIRVEINKSNKQQLSFTILKMNLGLQKEFLEKLFSGLLFQSFFSCI